MEQVRQAIVDVARQIFSERGYDATPTEDIIRAARVSRGGMYHHFPTKKDLFRSVLENVEREFIGRLARAGAPGDDLWEQIANGCQAFLDVSLEAPVRRIVLIDGPAVLGWLEWKDIETRFGHGLLRELVAQAISEGLIPAQPVDALAELLSGALNQAAMSIAHASDPSTVRRELGQALRWVFDSLRVRQPAQAS